MGEYTRDSELEDFQGVRLRTYFSYTGIEEKTIYYKVEAWKDGHLADLVVGNSYVQLREGKSRGRTTTTYFGAGLGDGNYELRVFYRFEDTEEWKEPLKASYTSSVNATIEGNLLTLRSTSLRPYQIDEAKWEGDCVVNRPMKVTVKWTRPVTNDAEVNDFYLWIEGDEFHEDEMVAGMTSYITKGATEELVFTFKPTHTGECRFYLTTDGDGYEVISYELFTITVKDMLPQNLDLTWDTENVKTESDDSYVLYGKDFQPMITVNNIGLNDYDDDIILMFTEIDENNNSVDEKIWVYKKVAVEAGGKTTFNASFNDLTDGKRYEFRGYHYTNENKGKTYYKYKFRAFFTVDASTGIDALKADKKADSPVYNLNGQRVDDTYKGLVIKNGKKYVAK